MDIHNYTKQYQRQIELLKEDPEILEVNKDISLKFKDYLLSEGIGVAKIGRYLSDVRKYSKILKKSFEDANKDDLRHVVGEIEQSNLTPESKKCFKIMLRKLYRFIRGIDEKGIMNECATALPKFKEWYEEKILPRIKDLGDVFRNFYYYDPKQKESCSIKYVLPVMSDLSYKDLDHVKKGDEASYQWEGITFTFIMIYTCLT